MTSRPMLKKALSQNRSLPKIDHYSLNKINKAQTTFSRCTSQLNQLKQFKASCISKLLKEVRETVKTQIDHQKQLFKQRQKKEKRKQRKENFVNKKQKKVYYDQKTQTNQNQPNLPIQTTRRLSCMQPSSIQCHEIQTLIKPPHRTKTAICIQGDKLYLYGGIGCQPNLGLAVFNLQTRKWDLSAQDKSSPYHPSMPIAGHSIGCYKGKGYIYGGKSTDIVNQLSIVNFKDLKFTQGQPCHYRRKDHAMVMVSKFMIIHGGIQANQVTNQIYYYNTETNTWTYPFVSPTLPFLANHSMASTYPLKTKKKTINSLSEITDPIFMFGGRDKKGIVSNTLYKVCVQNDSFVATKIQLKNVVWPQRRMQTAFHHIGSGYMLLYGGKIGSEQGQEEDYCMKSPAYILNSQKIQWSQVSCDNQQEERYGMASAAYNGKVYIFGGLCNNLYANGNVSSLSGWGVDLFKSKSNFGTRTVLGKQP